MIIGNNDKFMVLSLYKLRNKSIWGKPDYDNDYSSIYHYDYDFELNDILKYLTKTFIPKLCKMDKAPNIMANITNTYFLIEKNKKKYKCGGLMVLNTEIDENTKPVFIEWLETFIKKKNYGFELINTLIFNQEVEPFPKNVYLAPIYWTKYYNNKEIYTIDDLLKYINNDEFIFNNTNNLIYELEGYELLFNDNTNLVDMEYNILKLYYDY